MKIKIPAGTQITVNKPTGYGITPIDIVTKKELKVDVVWKGIVEYYFRFNNYTYTARVKIQKAEVI